MQRQRGTSLVSLMVGLTISLVVTAGLLAAYRQSVNFTSHAAQGASFNNQIASSLLRTAAAIQDAGYQITGAKVGTDLVLLSGPTFTESSATGSSPSVGTLSGGTVVSLSLGTSGNAVIWSMVPDSGSTQPVCAGFYAYPNGGLVYLTPVTCTHATDWPSLTWPTSTVAARSVSALNASDSSPSIAFVLSKQDCTPYGISQNKFGSYAVTVSGANNSVNTYTFNSGVRTVQCLVNFQ